MIYEEFFGKKPVIGVVHLLPLPGSPKFDGDFEGIVERALNDALKYYEGGVDAIIVENYGDKPFSIRVERVETIAAFATIAHLIRREVDLPLGLSLLRNSGPEAIGVAYVVGADFIRVNNLCQVLVSPEGLLNPVGREVAEKRRELNAWNIKVFADVNVKHATPVAQTPLEEVVKDCEERCLADAIIVTGRRTGEETSLEELLKVKSYTTLPVLVGSGVTVDNIERYWRYADGFIVGTYFKKNGVTTNPVDIGRVKKLMKKVEKLRTQ